MTQYFSKKTGNGVATLATVTILLFVATTAEFFLAKSGVTEQKIYANEYRSKQAADAAQAGIDYGAIYLSKNQKTILVDSDKDGKIDNYTNQNIKNVSLANGAHFNITYNNPEPNDFTLIQIVSTGTSKDGSVTQKTEELLKFHPTLIKIPNSTVTAKGKVKIKNNSIITNTVTNITVAAGEEVEFKNKGHTVSANGSGSSNGNINEDVQQKQKPLKKADNKTLFKQLFGLSKKELHESVEPGNVISNNFNKALNNRKGEIIWVEGGGKPVKIHGNITIGTPEKPVLLIVDGSLNIVGNVKIYGMIYVTKDLQTGGTALLQGSAVAGGNLNVINHFHLLYDETVLINLKDSIGTFVKVNGSWKDW